MLRRRASRSAHLTHFRVWNKENNVRERERLGTVAVVDGEKSTGITSGGSTKVTYWQSQEGKEDDAQKIKRNSNLTGKNLERAPGGSRVGELCRDRP